MIAYLIGGGIVLVLAALVWMWAMAERVCDDEGDEQ